MPTLSQPSPISRLAPLRRIPFWAQALALCALFAIVGVAVVDDYGVSGDEPAQRQAANAVAAYALGASEELPYTGADYALGVSEELPYEHNRYYGVAFEMPLLLIERALGLQDTRHIYLTRHLITHLFFIAGGFACGMLVYRMLGSRWIAALAMLMFMLHPRLYAHSFFNPKDVPFAATLLIALYLTHRAFRRDTLGAFLLCGIVVGLAINLRPFGLTLLALIPAMRALDIRQASGGEERKRILLASAAFLAAALAAVYITHPYYWENPLRFIEGVRVLSQHPTLVENLFMGEIYRSDAAPWSYIPVWFAITAPPLTLTLGAIGCAAVCWKAVARPFAALRDRETRFGILLLGCVAMPVAVAIILQSNIYNGWRHMYFLWAPFCLLAAVGLHTITNIRMGGGIWKVGALLPGWVRGGYRLHMARRALAYGVVGAGLITTLTAMASLHPHQQVYFNALVDTKTPGALSKRYDMDYWRMAHRQSLERLLARYPDDTLRVWGGDRNARILPQSDRERIVHTLAPDADFYFSRFHYRRDTPNPPTLHSIEAYGSAIAFILAPNSDAYRDHYRAEYNDIEANGTLLAQSAFDIYAHNGALRYLSANCAPLLTDADYGVFLHIIPNDPADLPADSRELGFENRDFLIAGRLALFTHTAFFDDKCVTRRPLPAYPIARIITGHKATATGNKATAGGEWSSDINLSARGGVLVYHKENCAPADALTHIFLHIFPADPANLPADRREYGFVNMGFQFAAQSADVVGECVYERELPDYPIARIRTGQDAEASGGDEWRVDIDLSARAAAPAIYDGIIAGKPAPQSDFNVHMRGGVLKYIKENCAPADARIFLHIFPADPADLPANRREHGFANLDFQFADQGADILGNCVYERELPDYLIARLRTGHNTAPPDYPEWREDIDLAAHVAAQGVHDRILAGDYGPPVAQSRFDIYLRDNALTYLKAPCAESDTDARFFLHITPAAPADLPADARERGFANLDFHFPDHGAYAGDICVASLDLPDYPIDRIRTGQFVSGEGDLWRVEFPALP